MGRDYHIIAYNSLLAHLSLS